MLVNMEGARPNGAIPLLVAFPLSSTLQNQQIFWLGKQDVNIYNVCMESHCDQKDDLFH